LRVDLHNHTTRCNHATGSMREYILRAIELQIDIYGFSEHAPMEYDKEYRMGFEEMDGYFQEIESLQNEFCGKIEILKALEVDFLPGFMDKRVLDAKVDYLIGSVHFLNGWGFDNPEFIGGYKERDIDEIYREYFKAIESMAQSGLFDVVGHLDLIKVFGYKPTVDIKSVAIDALQAISKSGMTIEINSAGLRKPIKEIYPSLELLQLAYEMNIDITFASDAHSIEQVGFAYDEAVAIAKSAGYKKCVYYKEKKKEIVSF